MVESNNYKDFNEMKKIYISNSFYKPFLEQMKVISHIYFKKSFENKLKIHISFSLNKKYTYIILVSIESILVNSRQSEAFFIFHLLCTPDVDRNSVLILKSLMNHFAENMELIFYGMGNIFKKRGNIPLSQAAYYRLLLPIIVKSSRVIYLDGDTLTLKDITDMYNSNFNDNYVLGFLGRSAWGLDYLGINAYNWINDGVMLLNLKKIRADNKSFNLLNITNSDIVLPHIDNTVINYALFPKIGKLSLKFGMWNFFDKSDIEKFSKTLRQKINISEYEIVMKDPSLIHILLCKPKPWNFKTAYKTNSTACLKRKNCSCEKFHNLWHFYAKKTDYYNDIVNYLHKNII